MKYSLKEFWQFGLKQAHACLFGGYLVILIFATNYWYPLDFPRYDFLFFSAVLFQAFLLVAKLETPREALVIVIFHMVATGMELFKTSDAIGSWKYPEAFNIGFANYPLFAGFMYSAVGSYIARAWRVFEFRFNAYPSMWLCVVLVLLIYVNFFTHHYIFDFRWLLVMASVWMFYPCNFHYRVNVKQRKMPMLLGFFLVALFIWFAENIATYSRAWIYPNQTNGWQMVSFGKLSSWYLLMLLSFVLVSLVHTPKMLENGVK